MTEIHKVQYNIRKGTFTDELLDWIKENGIPLRNFKFVNNENPFGRKQLVALEFVFTTAEDAMAFKIRWCGK